MNVLESQTEPNSEEKTTAQKPGKWRGNLVLGFLFFLAGLVAIRKLAAKVAEGSQWRIGPSPVVCSGAVDFSASERAEDRAFSEFLQTFRTGPVAASAGIPSSAAAAPESGSLHEFFIRSPARVGAMQKLLQEISRCSGEASRHRKMLADLYRELHALKGEAGFPELLPAWQLASALAGLTKQLTDNSGNVTVSTLRTIAGSLDLLEDFCKPGCKPDLLSTPPLRLLAVDDDLISRKAVAHALNKALTSPDLAQNGEAALTLATKHAYDVIFLDVQMPGMDGFELCSKIHESGPNRDTPVVFVTCRSDFDARAQSVLSGGCDLICKPFLTFEITVKALTLAMRGRMQGRTQILCSHDLRNDTKALLPVLPPTSDAAQLAPASELLPNDLAHAFLNRASSHLDPLRELIHQLNQTTDENSRMEMLADLYLHLNALAPDIDSSNAHPALRMNAALEGLLKKLLENPRNCTSSTLLTLAAAVDLLDELCREGVRADLAANPPIRLLVVDDDPLARRAIAGTLQLAFEKPESVEGGEAALTAATKKRFDVIFMDVQMPGMDGFTACSKIHETSPNHTTPVVFVTGRNDFQARARSTLQGGADLIGKPFLAAEITVKALTFALRGRLQKHAFGRDFAENSCAMALG